MQLFPDSGGCKNLPKLFWRYSHQEVEVKPLPPREPGWTCKWSSWQTVGWLLCDFWVKVTKRMLLCLAQGSTYSFSQQWCTASNWFFLLGKWNHSKKPRDNSCWQSQLCPDLGVSPVRCHALEFWGLLMIPAPPLFESLPSHLRFSIWGPGCYKVMQFLLLYLRIHEHNTMVVLLHCWVWDGLLHGNWQLTSCHIYHWGEQDTWYMKDLLDFGWGVCSAVYGQRILELYTWNVYDPIDRCHPNNFN